MVTTRYTDLVAAPEITLRFDEGDRIDAALEAAAARLGIVLTEVPPLPRLYVRVELPSDIQERARQSKYVCADRVLEVTFPRNHVIFLPPDWPWWLGAHACGHVLAYHCLGVEDDRQSETLARRAEGPGWLAQIFGRRDPWRGASWA